MRKVVALLISIFTVVSLHADIIMEPYLQAVTIDSVFVLLECDTQSPAATVNYGVTTGLGSSAAAAITEATTGGTYIHKIKITGLSSGTTYYYSVDHNGTTDTVRSFVTAPGTGSSFRFAWLADCRTGISIHDEIAGRINSFAPSVSLYGGDLCYDGTYSAYKNEFFVPNQRLLSGSVPFFNAVGNHEKWEQNTMAFTHEPDSDSNTRSFYSFEYGDMMVIVINNEIDYSVGSEQYKYINSALTNTAKTWKVAIFHKPAYCSGGHGEDPGMKAISENLFEPYGVDLTLSGHTHFYQHNYVNGIHHVVAGSSGSPLYDPVWAAYVMNMVKSQNFVIGDVTSSSFHIMVYDDKGEVLDSIDVGSVPVAKVTPAPGEAALEFLDNVFVSPSVVYNAAEEKSVTFYNLTENIELKIFNIKGELIFKDSINTPKGKYKWMIDSGISPGLYIYTLLSKNGGRAEGKIYIAR